jgi:hypothetical protein
VPTSVLVVLCCQGCLLLCTPGVCAACAILPLKYQIHTGECAAATLLHAGPAGLTGNSFYGWGAAGRAVLWPQLCRVPTAMRVHPAQWGVCAAVAIPQVSDTHTRVSVPPRGIKYIN